MSLENLCNLTILILEVNVSEKTVLCISFCIDCTPKKFITNLLLSKYPISQVNKKLNKKKKEEEEEEEEGIINEQCHKTHYKSHESENNFQFLVS